MNEWLTRLHEYFLDQKPFIVATVSAYHGSSPDTPGVGLLHSNSRSQRFINSDQRYTKMLTTASQLLSQPTRFHTEEFTLGKVAGSDNGTCDVIYEYFDAEQYPEWLTELRTHKHNGNSCTLLREFNNSDCNHVIRTEVLQDTEDNRKNTPHFYKGADCFAQKKGDSLLLLRRIQTENITITVIGNHAVAEEIQKQSILLPIEVTKAQSTAELSNNVDAIIIMTNDHELDYQYCEAALKQQTRRHPEQHPEQQTTKDTFIGCIGSEKKASIFTDRLIQSGVSTNQLKHFHMPVGVAQIAGKHKSVVAASIIAQILMRHQW